jgi:uncharacterized membrane protein YccC
VLEWLARRDPDHVTLRRAVRVATATCLAFYVGRYLIDDATLALFAAFTCIALGALSDIGGRPGQRTVTMLLAAALGAVLVTVGTFLSVTTAAATAGMLVVGFVVALAGIGGPRVAGVANGWQLLYILPSFPPYDPGSLGARLTGLALGLACLICADRLLLPPPVPVGYPAVLADAAAAVGDHLAVVSCLLAGEPVSADELAATSARSRQAVNRARTSATPVTQRPSGPTRADRALLAASSAVRMTAGRVDDLQWALQHRDGPPRAHHGEELVRVAHDCLLRCADALRGGALPDVVRLEAELTRTQQEREHWLVAAVSGDEPLDARVAVGTTTIEVAQSARVLSHAVVLSRTGRMPAGSEPVERQLFWFADAGWLQLGATRLRGHLTVRSVWFRNALRVAVALGAARALAGVLDLSHGFWVLLATLTLMRTTFVATRAEVVPALLGTLVGAALAVPLLVGLGQHQVALAVLLPVLIVAALAGGPLLGPAYGQAGFTLTVAALFSQVYPPSLSLAGWRLLDVTVGASIGVLAGMLAWPRGASGQLVAQCRDALRRSATALVATADALTRGSDLGAEVDHLVVEARRSLLFAGETVGFAMGEPVNSGLGTHWRELLDASRHMVEGGQYVRSRRTAQGPVPWPEAGALLTRLALDDKVRADQLAAALPDPAIVPAPAPTDGLAGWLRATVTGPLAPPEVLDVIDARGWLVAVRRDLDRAAAG